KNGRRPAKLFCVGPVVSNITLLEIPRTLSTVISRQMTNPTQIPGVAIVLSVKLRIVCKVVDDIAKVTQLMTEHQQRTFRNPKINGHAMRPMLRSRCIAVDASVRQNTRSGKRHA